MLKATVKNATAATRGLRAAQVRENKSLQTAVKVEAFRLSKVLKQEIRSGAPGGDRFAPMTFLARRKGKSFKANKPLARLALPIRYHVRSQNPYSIAVGWTGPKVSDSWKSIAERQQAGFTQRVSDPQRRFFYHRGDELSRRSKYRKFLFLREDTRSLQTKPRPIVDPFWQAHQLEAWRNIQNNFKRKLRGERI